MKLRVVAGVIIALLLGYLTLMKTSTAETVLVGQAQTVLVGQAQIDGRALAASVGLKTLGGIFSPLLSQGAELPASIDTTFSTGSDNQTQIQLMFFTGNADYAAENVALSTVEVTGFSTLPRGGPQVVVNVLVDIEGNVYVSATEGGAALDVGLLPETSN